MLKQLEHVDGVSGVLAIEKYIGALIPEEFLPSSIKSIFKHGGKEMIAVSSIYRTSMPESLSQLDEIGTIVKKVRPARPDHR